MTNCTRTKSNVCCTVQSNHWIFVQTIKQFNVYHRQSSWRMSFCFFWRKKKFNSCNVQTTYVRFSSLFIPIRELFGFVVIDVAAATAATAHFSWNKIKNWKFILFRFYIYFFFFLFVLFQFYCLRNLIFAFRTRARENWI